MSINSTTDKFITESCKAKSISSIDLIQKLWSDYGSLNRVYLTDSIYNSVIVKHINLSKKTSHPRNWNTDNSHNRKLKSYQVETEWYKNFNSFRDKDFYFPKYINSLENNDSIILILEDLDSIGFTKRLNSCSPKEIELCLNSLSSLHAKGLNYKPQHKLWDKGSYWHLDTRIDELNAMEDCDLKIYASKIDNTLHSAKFKTIIHGDAKIANFCFDENSDTLSVVDFQYIGNGCGIIDFIYFLSSVLDEFDLEKYSNMYLEKYFVMLDNHINKLNIQIDFDALKKEWTHLYNFAIADFERFLLGWMPTHYKLNSYTKNITNILIKNIKSDE